MEKTISTQEVNREFPYPECEGCEYMAPDESGKGNCHCLSIDDAPGYCHYLK